MDELRVSVATYDQVLFSHPEHGMTMLALERKATVLKDGSVKVRAQPFGGGVKILDPSSLGEMLGELRFDSERSKQDQDLRILIPPSKWDEVRQYCLRHLEDLADNDLESSPVRELTEEFEETLSVDLKPEQYTFQPIGSVVEDHPVWTENWYARGFPTVRVYRTYSVQLLDVKLCRTLLAASQEISDEMLGKRAMENETGRANSVLVLPLNSVTEAWLALPPELRYRKIKVEGYELDESVLAVLGDVEVPQYQRINKRQSPSR